VHLRPRRGRRRWGNEDLCRRDTRPRPHTSRHWRSQRGPGSLRSAMVGAHHGLGRKVDEVAIYSKVLDAAGSRALPAGHRRVRVGPATSDSPLYSKTVWSQRRRPTPEATASDLAGTLQTITGQTFSVSTETTAPSDSIQLIRYQGCYHPATAVENRVLNAAIGFQYALPLTSHPINAFAVESRNRTSRTDSSSLPVRTPASRWLPSYYLKFSARASCSRTRSDLPAHSQLDPLERGAHRAARPSVGSRLHGPW